MKRFLIAIYMLLLCYNSVAQQRTITGTVKDNDGPLIGVSILEKGVPGNGTVTNAEGRFSIALRGQSQVLVVQYIGYLTKEVNVSGISSVEVTLDVDAKGLEEVVVVAYGTQKKITNTGAISAISGDNIRQVPSASLQNTLIGRVPGVVTQQRSGRPGGDGAALLIRGLSTSNGNGAPLVIVDDLEYAGSISEIDPDQIESFTILKDASTTAVYGIRGANGVVVITTRRGKVGSPQISVRTENSIHVPNYLPEYLDSYHSALLINQAIDNDRTNGLSPSQRKYTDEELELFRTGADPYRYPNVDWTEELLRPYSLQTRNNINVQGGLDKAKYFVSAGYLWQNGLLRDFSKESEMNSNYYYRRYNFRSNLDIQPISSLNLSLDLSGNFAETNTPVNGGRNNRNNIFFEISDFNQLPPFAYNIYNPDGSYGANPNLTNNNVVGRLALYGYQREFTNDLTANFRATQKLDFLTKGLSVRGVLGYNSEGGFHRNLTRTDFPSYVYNPDNDTYSIFNTNVYRIGLPSRNYGNNAGNKKLTWQATVNYDRQLNNHHIYGLALYSYQNNTEGSNEPAVFEGYTFRAGYDYQKKYLLEFNAGYNGSSRFSNSERYAFFPAVSAGWNIAEEPFFKNNIKFIDLFKIRGSYGLTGSDNVGNFSYVYIQNYNRTGSYSLGESHTNISTIVEGALANNSTWEVERQSNIGVDINMFEGKLNVVADVFDRYRRDILNARESVPSFSGVTLPPSNIGRVSNKGFEAQITYNGKAKDLSYNISGNVSYAKNKVLFRDEATPEYPWLAFTGHPLGSILGYQSLGFYTEEDIANPDVPKPVTGQAFAGDLKYADMNGNGVIDDNDKVIMSYPNLPNTILGMTIGLNYKNFGFTVTAQSALNFSLRAQAEAVRPFINNFREIHQNAWTPENSVNPDFPRLSTVSNISDPNANPSSFWFRRSDYLRIKTAELSYTLPNRFVRNIGLKDVRVYLNGYNMFTWNLKEKNIYDIDPENSSGTDGANFYPQTKIYNLGLQVSF